MFTASALCALLVASNTPQLGTAEISTMLERKHKKNTTYRVQVRVESRHYLAPNVGSAHRLVLAGRGQTPRRHHRIR